MSGGIVFTIDDRCPRCGQRLCWVSFDDGMREVSGIACSSHTCDFDPCPLCDHHRIDGECINNNCSSKEGA